LERARKLRCEQTIPEATVWKRLRARRLNGVKFTRQVPIGPYIADFVARREKLAIELDGRSHDYSGDYDQRRDAFMVGLGYRVLRFSNREVSTNLDGIASAIDHALKGQ